MITFEMTDLDKGLLQGHEESYRQLGLSKEEAKLAGLLRWVVQRGSLAQLQEVLAVGAQPNTRQDPRDHTLLGMAIHWRSERTEGPEVFRKLVEAGADPTELSVNNTLMSLAWKHGNSKWAVPLLLNLVPPGNLSQADLNKALLVGAGDASVLKRALQLGASVNHREVICNAFIPSTPVSALMVASCFANPETVQLLLEAGADVNLQDGEGHTALDYAMFDPKECRKVIPLLEKAGAISAKPFPRPSQATRGFATAAKKPAFKEAIARIQQLTGLKKKPLHGPEEKIPGGVGFLFDEDPAKTFVEQGPAEYIAVGDKLRKFVEQHQAEIRALGAYLFHTRDLTERNGPAIALLPTADVFKAIAAVGTESSDVFNDDLIAWLRELEKDQPFLITGIGSDFIEGTFTSSLNDPAALVKRINKLCPDGDEGPEVEAEQIRRLTQTKRLFL